MNNYVFYEPHFTGGHSAITISEKQMINYQRTRQSEKHPNTILSDEGLLLDFIATNWAEPIKIQELPNFIQQQLQEQTAINERVAVALENLVQLAQWESKSNEL